MHLLTKKDRLTAGELDGREFMGCLGKKTRGNRSTLVKISPTALAFTAYITLLEGTSFQSHPFWTPTDMYSEKVHTFNQLKQTSII